MQDLEWKNIVIKLLNNWFSLRKSMYFIVIKDIYLCPKTNRIMIKYQCSNKRIGDNITLEDFMKSPLKHATYPDQMFHIGVQTERMIEHFKNTKQSPENIQPLLRFKKIFYNSHGTI